MKNVNIRSEGTWKKLVDDYERSNLSKAKFCVQNNLIKGQFYYWCRKLRPDLNEPINMVNTRDQQFVQISPQKTCNLSFTLDNGIKVNFNTLPDPTWVADLLFSVGKTQ